MLDTKKVHIIGGGISGITTALTLQKLNINYQLFEKSNEITYDNVGLGISANIFPILKSLNILEETKKLGAEIKKFHFVDSNLKVIKTFRISTPPLSVNRKLFHKLLFSKLKKGNLHLGISKSVDDFHEDDLVISADGINSKSRQKIYPNLKLRDSNQILWRGICEINLQENFKNSYHVCIGNNLRFAIIHTGENFYSWYAIKEKNNSKIPSKSKDFLIDLFQNYHPIIKKIINESQNIYYSELKDISPNRRKNLNWFCKNVVFIGDAIHPTTPNMANGACLAIEDAYLLPHLLYNNDLEIEEIFKKFQKMRTKKVDAIVFQSWWFGKLMHQKSKFIDRITKLGITLTPKFLFNKIYSKVLIGIEN